MEQQDKYIRFDWAVKRLLRQKANFGVLEGFLTVLLGENVKIIEILDPKYTGALLSGTHLVRSGKSYH